MPVTPAVKYFCIICVVFSLLHLQSGEAQSVIPRVERLDTYAVDPNPLPGSSFLVPLGQTVKLYCICNGYTMVQLLHNDSVVRSRPSCSIILHIVHNVSYSDEGRYTCRVLDASNHTCDRSLGNLSAIDPDVVVAESRQYGILNANSSLNCTSTLDVFQDMIVYKWFRGSGKDRVRLEGRPERLEFVNTNYSHQGIYTCEVYISSVDIKIEKIVEFLVIDPTTTETPPTTKTPPKSKTPPSSGTPPTFITLTSVNITSQEVSSDSPMTGNSKPLLNASLLLTIAMLLGT